jgi:hypothetical protein
MAAGQQQKINRSSPKPKAQLGAGPVLPPALPYDGRFLKEGAAVIANDGCVLQKEDGESRDTIFS